MRFTNLQIDLIITCEIFIIPTSVPRRPICAVKWLANIDATKSRLNILHLKLSAQRKLNSLNNRNVELSFAPSIGLMKTTDFIY